MNGSWCLCFVVTLGPLSFGVVLSGAALRMLLSGLNGL